MKIRSLYAAALAGVLASMMLLGIVLSPRSAARAAIPSPIDPVVHDCNITKPDVPITPTLLTSGLPCSATIIAPFTLDNIQHGFDYYSWLTFLALNAPAGGTTPIGKGSGPGGDAATIWENWQDLNDMVPPSGGAPPPWGHRAPPPPACRVIGATTSAQVMQMIAKLPNLEATNQPFKDGPLIDQSGRYVRYQILANKPMFEYIVRNHLYNKSGQAKFTGTIDFPQGKVSSDTTGTVGAIMIKAAWKILDGKDNRRHFHTMLAYVYTPPSTNPVVHAECKKQIVALVGLHVVHKTKSDPQWVWTTFEHVDNVPTPAQMHGHLLAHYNFYNPACDTTKCPVNSTPPPPWNPNNQPFPGGFTSQIVRVIGLQPDVDTLNTGFQSILAPTVWAHYKLISTQWPTNPTNPVDPTGSPAPVFLANTTMETYIQGRVPNVSSSCIRCHNIATDTAQKNADFTYILSQAK